jgi:hypothetical protein
MAIQTTSRMLAAIVRLQYTSILVSMEWVLSLLRPRAALMSGRLKRRYSISLPWQSFD